MSHCINTIGSASKLWKVSISVDKQRLQGLIFSEGLTYDFVEGLRIPKLNVLYEVVNQVAENNDNMVGLDRVELSTKWL